MLARKSVSQRKALSERVFDEGLFIVNSFIEHMHICAYYGSVAFSLFIFECGLVPTFTPLRTYGISSIARCVNVFYILYE